MSVVALVIVIYILGIQKWEGTSKDKWHIITTSKGEKTIIELSDESKVWLNGETSLIYRESFGKKNREVVLSGEAYFQVTKQGNKSFVVRTDDLNIEVLGTQFNVKTSANEPSISTTVVEGMVKIVRNNKNEKEELILVSGQQLLFDRQKSVMSLQEVDSRLYTAWKEGRISFDHEQIKNIFTFIEQNFHVTICLKNKQIAERRYTGRFSLDVKPDKILTLIQQSIPFDFHIRNDTICIN